MISTSKTKLCENYVLYSYISFSVTAAMLNTLVKSDIIEREPRNILVFHHSQGKLSKITLKLQPCMIICFFLTVVCPEDFSIPAKSSGNFKLEIQESILIKLLKPTLNKNISSVPLYLFWYDNGFCNYRVFVFPGPRPSILPPALAPNLYLSALAPNFYLPVLVSLEPGLPCTNIVPPICIYWIGPTIFITVL